MRYPCVTNEGAWVAAGRRRPLQRFAVCCSVLQCIAVTCSVSQCAAVRCRVMQCGAVWCSVAQCGAVWGNVLWGSYDDQRHSVVRCGAVEHGGNALWGHCWAMYCGVATMMCGKMWRSVRQWGVMEKLTMGLLRSVESIKLHVSFAKEPYKRDYILQKRPII